ncbi:hypothetical protein BCR37DRAFT_387006 [Protomyces lactucae-debilis]|uniref:Uncharacterized protein n=1 Tax=Protomyces lactucae-debilis TaxID=2754530 RepID=A0A1Y2FIR1_PROLT|nr:uncharacterized protein BCR37DRAFT_387006 [Protomyces lactucae-debilis]ORY83136.1 hypothetical protein BCR37DRAFT_387006 [Protomyces lactucae-debilis]
MLCTMMMRVVAFAHLALFGLAGAISQSEANVTSCEKVAVRLIKLISVEPWQLVESFVTAPFYMSCALQCNYEVWKYLAFRRVTNLWPKYKEHCFSLEDVCLTRQLWKRIDFQNFQFDSFLSQGFQCQCQIDLVLQRVYKADTIYIPKRWATSFRKKFPYSCNLENVRKRFEIDAWQAVDLPSGGLVNSNVSCAAQPGECSCDWTGSSSCDGRPPMHSVTSLDDQALNDYL